MNNKWYTSSTGTGELALTIKGFLTAIIPLIIVALRYFHVEVKGDLQPVIDDIEMIVVLFGGLVSGVMTIVGLVRKIYFRFK